MLESSLLESRPRRKTRKPATLVVSALAHVVTVGILILIPLLQTQALTIPPVDMSRLLPRIERARNVDVFTAQRSAQRPRPAATTAFTSPVDIPQDVAFVDAPAIVDFPFPPSINGNGSTAFTSNIPHGAIAVETPLIPVPAPPPLAPPPAPVKTQPYRQGGDVQAARLLFQVKPQYPPIAQRTHTQGMVILEAVIDKEGSIAGLRVVSGHVLLNQAAIDAVKQWKYRPTILNSEPVDVVTTITVTFTLQ